jgi:hypothetical protein
MIVWLASYPKSGNTWLRTIIAEILSSVHGNDDSSNPLININNIKSYPLIRHYDGIINKSDTGVNRKKLTISNWITTQEKINLDNEIKIFKTHNYACKIEIAANEKYAFTDLKNSLGVIYIVRDPRNVITSINHHFSHDNFDQSFKMMSENIAWINSNNSDRIPEALSSWDEHYESWARFPKNFLLIKYEDLLTNSQKEIKRIYYYLKKFYKIKKPNMDNIIQNTKFENLKNLENKFGFVESVTDKTTNKQKSFFNLGPKNNWQELLDSNTVKKINNRFYSTMIKLGYL